MTIFFSVISKIVQSMTKNKSQASNDYLNVLWLITFACI